MFSFPIEVFLISRDYIAHHVNFIDKYYANSVDKIISLHERCKRHNNL